MAAVDRAMSEVLAIDLRQVMETAGREVARFARDRLLGGDPRFKRGIILCGTGGNGGDGFVAARILQGWGAEVTVIAAKPRSEIGGVAGQQAEIIERCGIPVHPPEFDPWPEADLVIDALLGFSLSGAPRGCYADLIDRANAQPAPVLAVDLPSGLDGDTGEPFDPCIRATLTLTLGLPKRGLLAANAREYVGSLTVADVGIPLAAYRAVGLEIGPVFAQSEWIDLF
jgi:NAD(P)H-hydrate epimerase